MICIWSPLAPVGLDARGRPLPSSSAMAAWDREVTNIPGNLDINDITKAFEDEAGKILDCTPQKGDGVDFVPESRRCTEGGGYVPSRRTQQEQD